MTKSTMTSKCTSIAADFEGLANALEQYRRHCPVHNVSRATTEATGCQHWATTHSILPQRPPGQQAYKQQSTNTRAKMAISMAMAMCRCVTACITQWRRSRASIAATGCRHWVSITPDNIVRTWLGRFFYVFIVKTVGKGHGLTLRTLFLIGV
jgi:hypothetical protein